MVGTSSREPSFLFMPMSVKYRCYTSSKENVLGKQYTFINISFLTYICDCILNQHNETNN